MNNQDLQYGVGSNDGSTPESLVLGAMSAMKPGQAFPDMAAAVITPELAKQLLRFNSGNRKLSKAVVKRYATLMKSDQWHLSSALMFTDQHQLIDGQHRLEAVCEAQVAIDFFVQLNVPSQVAVSIDRGFRRTATHACHVSGKTWVNKMHTAIVRYMTVKLVTSEDGVSQLWTARPLGVEETMIALDKYEEVVKFVASKLSSSPVNLATVLSVIVKACYARLKDRQRIEHFCDCLITSQAKKDMGDNAACLLVETIGNFRKEKGSENGVNWNILQHSNCIAATQIALELFLRRVNTLNYGKKGLTNRFPDKDLFPLPLDLLNFSKTTN